MNLFPPCWERNTPQNRKPYSDEGFQAGQEDVWASALADVTPSWLIVVRLSRPHLYTPGLLLQSPLLSIHGQARTPGLLSGCGAAVAPHSHGPPPPRHPGLCTWDPNPRAIWGQSPAHLISLPAALHTKWACPETVTVTPLCTCWEDIYFCVSIGTAMQYSRNYIILPLPDGHWEKGSSKWGGNVIERHMLLQHPGFPCL